MQGFNRQHQGQIRVTYRNFKPDRYLDELRRMFSGTGRRIDVIGGDVIWPAEFASKSWIADLSSRLPQSERQQFLPGTIQANTFLVDRSLSYRDIARQFGVSKDAVSRHVSEGHISELLTLATDAQRAAQADTLLDRIEALQRRVEAFLSRVEETDNYSATLGAFRELRANLELIGEVTKELARTPTFNLHVNPEWIELRTVIVRAIEPYPHARESFLQAIEGVGDGHNTR